METLYNRVEYFFLLFLNFMGEVLSYLPEPWGDPFAYLFMRRAF